MSTARNPCRPGFLRPVVALLLLAAAGCDSGIHWLEVTAEEGLALPRTELSPAQETRSMDLPSPAALRAEAIRSSLQALQDECARYGGGDWSHWSNQLEPFRAALRARIDQTPANYPLTRPVYTNDDFLASYRMLEARGQPPLFEPAPESYLAYLLEPSSLESFSRRCPVAAVSRWLHSQGIDLIFVPIPKMTEVYPERMARPCPADRIVAPHVRKLHRDLLEQDVEVVDVLPPLLAAPDRDNNPLYLPDDPHWSRRGQQIAARVIAEHLRRYDFVRHAREQPPLFEWIELPCHPHGTNYRALTPEQQRRCATAAMKYRFLVSREDADIVDEHSPLLLIGDSYNDGLDQCLAQELNLPIAVHTGGGHTTQAIIEAVRNPTLLQHRKVVVWTVCHPALRMPPMPWNLPTPVARYLTTHKSS